MGSVKSVQNFGADDMLEIAPATGGPTWYLPFTKRRPSCGFPKAG